MSPNRLVVFYVDGARYEAPEAWMMGAHWVRVRRGMDEKAAYLDAMRHWAEQQILAAEHEANH